MKERATLVKELTFLIEKGNAHASFEDTVAALPAGLRTVVPDHLPYSIWQLTEHIRITQWDIVEFCLSEKHRSPKWPEGYWPAATGTVSDAQWTRTIEQVIQDRNRFIALLQDERQDLFGKIPWGEEQTILREALLIADHTAYHTGQILVLRRLLGCWE